MSEQPPTANFPLPVQDAVERYRGADATTLHRLAVELAKLLAAQAPPAALNQLALAERFLEGQASAADLGSARQDCWTYIGSLACNCSVTDTASAQAILSCLEPDREQHSFSSLCEQIRRVLQCDVAPALVVQSLR